MQKTKAQTAPGLTIGDAPKKSPAGAGPS